jgi:hypothetical protein
MPVVVVAMVSHRGMPVVVAMVSHRGMPVVVVAMVSTVQCRWWWRWCPRCNAGGGGDGVDGAMPVVVVAMVSTVQCRWWWWRWCPRCNAVRPKHSRHDPCVNTIHGHECFGPTSMISMTAMPAMTAMTAMPGRLSEITHANLAGVT